MIKLHLLTACTRPQHITRISASIDAARCEGVDLVWHMMSDPERRYVGGQGIKNALIERVTDGWLSVLDDDNLLHPDLPGRVRQVIAGHPDAALIVVGQLLPGGGQRSAVPGCLTVDRVDAAQMIICRDALGGLRIPETYAGDGLLAQELAAVIPTEQIVYLDAPLSSYNRLVWGDL